jgi:phosphomevalonate kinase
MYYLIGITGKKQSGKDTVCSIIQKILQPKSVVRIAFADALKEEVAKACGVSIEYINRHKDNFRLILQGWGTNYRRQLFGNDYWIYKYLLKAKQLPSDTFAVVVTDVRFLNEFHALNECYGKVIRVTRPTDKHEDRHPSEAEMELIKADFCIQNNGTLQSLEEQVRAILKQIIK